MIKSIEIKKTGRKGYKLYILYFEDNSSVSLELSVKERYEFYRAIYEVFKNEM